MKPIKKKKHRRLVKTPPAAVSSQYFSRLAIALRSLMPAALCAWVLMSGSISLTAGQFAPFELRPAVQVDGRGVFLHELLQCDPQVSPLRLCDSPAAAGFKVLTRAQVGELVRAAGSDLTLTNWTGPDSVRISRRLRTFAQAEALQLLTAVLQEQFVKDRGELELRVSRAWETVNVPDEPLELKVLNLPTMGVTPAFIIRFELETARGERIGPWQATLQAQVWREAWVARSAAKRGELIQDAELARERIDVLLCREPVAEFDQGDPELQLAEALRVGAPVLARSVMARPVILRGQSVVGLVQDGALAITMKVEALENGARGQIIRLRNPVSRRDLHGKVLTEESVLLAL